MVSAAHGGLEEALAIAESLRTIDDDAQLDDIKTALVEQAERLEKRVGEKKAVRWYKTAVGERPPFKLICERCVGHIRHSRTRMAAAVPGENPVLA